MATQARTIPEVREAYSAYTPPLDVAAVVRDLLSYVPASSMRGLDYVVLLNASGLSRRDRRQRIPARGQKYPAGACLGFYRRPRPGEPAHIGLHVDRILQQAPRLALRVTIYRDFLFAPI